jgi:transposase-like protein
MIGPRNRPPASCPHGHTTAYALHPQSPGPGWRWECRACHSARQRRRRVRLAADEPCGWAQRQSARREDIVFWLDSGYTHRDIAAKLGIQLDSHYAWLTRHGLANGRAAA